MTFFYIGAAIGLVLAIVYLEVALVPGFGWKASLAVLTSFVLLVVASYSGVFWYVLALSGLGTAAAVIVAFVLELRNDRAGTVA
jgi:hypothetical protein